ncbi:MAG: discoidin domain-containing protein [Kiritimatiellia bacterium]
MSSNASNEDLAWGRALVNTWVPQMKAGQKVVDTTSLVWRRNSPIPSTTPSRTSWPAAGSAGRAPRGPSSSARRGASRPSAWPSPRTPRSATKDVDGRWQTGYGRGWAASRTSFGSGNEFIEGMEQRLQTEKFMTIERPALAGLGAEVEERGDRLKRRSQRPMRGGRAGIREGRRTRALRGCDARAEPPVNVPPGVIHIPAASFERDGGITVWGGHPGVVRVDSPGGGRQAFFQGALASAWAGYRITVPRAGVYELTAQVAAGNTDQSLYVRSYGAMLPVRKATAQHVYRDNQKDFGPHLLVDQDPGTRWSANEGNDRCRVELDLGRPERISTVLIDERAWNRVSKFNFQYQSGDDWKTIFEGTDIGIDFARDFDPVTAQRVRLNILDTREQMGFGPTIWELGVGTVQDGRAWIKVPLTHGLWGVTDPVDLSLAAGEQLVWVFAPFQRGVAVKWFQLKPKPAGASSAAPAARPALSAPQKEEEDTPAP